jgi:methionine synthase II (cobalamin-independent)
MHAMTAPSTAGTHDGVLPRNPPRAESVGSLLRPAPLREVFDRVYSPHVSHVASVLSDSERADLASIDAEADSAIRSAISKQIDAGLDVVTDGEMRRAHFANSLFDALGGVIENPNHYEFFGETDVAPPPEPMANERLSLATNPLVKEVAFLREATDYPFKVTLLAPSAALFASVEFNPEVYPSRVAFADHATSIVKEIAAGAIEAGVRYLQFDFPLYPGLVDPEKSGELLASAGLDRDALLSEALRLDAAVLEGIPESVTTGLHICRGNFRSQWWSEGSLEPVAERMFSELHYDRFLIEWEDTNRQGDYSPLRFVPSGGPTVVMGVISSKLEELESDDEIRRRLDVASRYLSYDQLALSPQCGFASVWYGNRISEQNQWRKLELVGRVADSVWGR